MWNTVCYIICKILSPIIFISRGSGFLLGLIIGKMFHMKHRLVAVWKFWKTGGLFGDNGNSVSHERFVTVLNRGSTWNKEKCLFWFFDRFLFHMKQCLSESFVCNCFMWNVCKAYRRSGCLVSRETVCIAVYGFKVSKLSTICTELSTMKK